MPKVVDHEQRRRELVTATRAVISDAGLEGATLRRIAEEAGCTTGRITHYFADRDELLIAALRKAHDAAGARMITAAAAASDPAPRLRAVLHHALPLDTERTAEWKVWLAFWSAAATDPRLSRENTRRYREWTAFLVDLIHAAVPDADAAAEARRLIALTDGLGLRAVLQPTRTVREQIIETLDEHLASLTRYQWVARDLNPEPAG